MKPPRVLIVAGSDSGGGAGIQADIKTVTMLGGFATTAITAITAQNSLGVSAVMPVPAEMVLAQIDAVGSDIGVDAVKIGMIGSAETAEAVAEVLSASFPRDQRSHRDAADAAPLPACREGGESLVPIVFDPVMVASSGSVLADDATIAAFDKLARIATLVTPNAPELGVLTGRSIESIADLEGAARELAARTGSHILAKGGHLAGQTLTDLLASPDGSVRNWSSPRIESRNTHGTGCTLASAIATHLGRGRELADAIERAREFVRIAMRAAPGFGAGHGPMGHQEAAFGEMNLDQVTLPALDYAGSVAFYRTLGLRQIVDSPGRYARFECPGGATLSIHVDGGQAGDTAIYLQSAELDTWVERLQAAGVVFESLPEDQDWGWREARLRDPAGNRLVLYRAGENRRFPPWRLDTD